jgi:cytochrome c oxidase subunit I
VERNRLLLLAHLSAAFLCFLPAICLGVWQMLMRSPLPATLSHPNAYYASLTAHGSIMAYVFPTLFIMGFGYAIANSAMGGQLRGVKWGWFGFWLSVIGTIMAIIPIAEGQASVLYTFYPTLIGSSWYYLGIVLAIVGSYVWIAVMVINMRVWKQLKPVPLSLFGINAPAILWGWTALGTAAEIVFQILPVAFGWRFTIDAGLGRTLFSTTLHAIVYFWLFPTYIAYYTLMPQAAGGRLYSDKTGRVAFILFVAFSLPVGMPFNYPQVCKLNREISR